MYSDGFDKARFIPASAGNSMFLPSSLIYCPVHPRERGEQEIVPLRVNAIYGSSPRARGTDESAFPDPITARFIPASAGNSCQTGGIGTARTVHPRERGEQAVDQFVGYLAGGSSPRARGTGLQGSIKARGERFIPASAGNRCPSTLGSFLRTVHPRERGEQDAGQVAGVFKAGSSPRARGTGHVQLQPGTASRFIPASAGNRKPKCSGAGF